MRTSILLHAIRSTVLVLCASATACSGGDDGPSSAAFDAGAEHDAAEGTGGADAAAACAEPGFAAAATELALPGEYTANTFGRGPRRLSSCGGTDAPGYEMIDLDGDGDLDIVVTESCDDDSVGGSRWLLHANTGAGFAGAINFPLPPGYPIRTFSQLDRRDLECGTSPSYGTLDMDGDHRPDLVVVEDCDDDTVGHTRWLVYRNTGAGFAATATDFALPPGFAAGAFTGLERSGFCDGADEPGYSTTDVDGDGLPDLLIDERCGDPDVGQSEWLLYRNTGAGFDDGATELVFPAGYSSGAFSSHLGRHGAVCPGESDLPGYLVRDVTGDGRLDLLILEDCDDAEVGTTKWMVHEGTGAGFSAAAELALPSGIIVDGPEYSAPVCEGSSWITYRTDRDADGDGRVDLVVQDHCTDPTVGDTRWLVHRGTGAGFAGAEASLTLPTGYPAGTFADVAREVEECDLGRPAYLTIDVDGDHREDLLVYVDCADPSVGDTKWLVYRNECR